MTGAAREGGSRRTPRRARFRAPGSLERPRIRGHSEHHGDSGEQLAGRHGEPGGQSQKPRQVFHACLPFGVLGRIGDPGPAPRAARRWQRAEQFWQSDGRGLDCTPDGLYSPAMSRRIAIVEDDPTIRANYAEALRKHGFEVAAYAARAEALAAMSARLPDLALIDIGLGADIDGGFTLTEFWMVHAVCKFPEHVKSREQLMREANLVVDEGTIPSHVKRIRRKFLAADPRFDAIDTVYGMGYRWKA